MIDRAVDVINRYLGIYNPDGELYKKLIGDPSRLEVKIVGGSPNVISFVDLLGVTLSNTDNMKLYFKIQSINSTLFNIWLYKDSVGTQEVARGSPVPLKTASSVTMVEHNGSGISGKINIQFVATNSDSANNIMSFGLGLREGVPLTINELNIGAISNPVEYTRRLMAYFVDQLDLSKASSDWLDYIGTNFFAVMKNAGELDADYYQRIYDEVFLNKMTVPMLVKALQPYAEEVQIVEGVDDGAFSEQSFADSYRDFNQLGVNCIKGALAGQTNTVSSVITGDVSGQLSHLELYGANYGNTDNMNLYWNLLREIINSTYLSKQGDYYNCLQQLIIDGGTLSNTDNMKLYWTTKFELTPEEKCSLFLYKDFAKTQLVAQMVQTQFRPFYGVIEQMNGSGITGSVYVSNWFDDSDNLNIINLDPIYEYLFSLYKDSAKTLLVAEGGLPIPSGTLTIMDRNGSGLDGQVDIAWTVNDSDSGNKIAILISDFGFMFFFRVILTNVYDPTKYMTIVNIVNKLKAVGVKYEIQVITI